MNCENCANAYDEGYTAGHNAENARLREYAQSGAATFDDLYVRDQEIARLRAQAEALATALGEIERETEHVNTRRGSRNGRIREVAQTALRAYREGRPDRQSHQYEDDGSGEMVCAECGEDPNEPWHESEGQG